jgi:DTW domain-containing protein YfiP
MKRLQTETATELDAIVLILDKLDDLEKAEMLAKMFAAFVRNGLSELQA